MKIYDYENEYGDIEGLKKRRKAVGFSGANLIDENYDFVENLIGKLKYPVGVAGPVDFGFGDKFVPLATTESSLVASVNRGFKYLFDAELSFDITDQGITRAPGFRFNSSADAQAFADFVNNENEKIEALINGSSDHLTLLDYEVIVEKKDVFVRFAMNPDQAMGMNMSTIAVNNCVKEYILKESPVEVKGWVLSSNVCTDKKHATINREKGRGINITVRAVLKDNIFDDLEYAQMIFDLKYRAGSSVAGIDPDGSNGHVANIIAAQFVAFGQDLANVVESSFAKFDFTVEEGKLVFSLNISNLIIGIIGGGTQQKYVREFFKDLEITHKFDLANVISVSALAGEISLFKALVENQLAESHDKLRKKL